MWFDYDLEFDDLKIPEILQVETPQVPGSLASVLNAIAEAGLVLEHVTTMRREQGRTLWEITFEIEEGAQEDLLRRASSLPSARFVGWSDRVFERRRGAHDCGRSAAGAVRSRCAQCDDSRRSRCRRRRCGRRRQQCQLVKEVAT
jgi:hypothetical protein